MHSDAMLQQNLLSIKHELLFENRNRHIATPLVYKKHIEGTNGATTDQTKHI